MTEKLLQTIWSFQFFNRHELATTNGDKLEILQPGNFNQNQGPDFLNARIRLGNTVLAGSIELHLKTSDWNRHGHSSDVNYNNVILHVVLEDDLQPSLPFATLELKNRISKMMLEQYQHLLNQPAFIPCGDQITSVNALTLQAWQERLVAERLTRKAKRILNIFEKTGHHWEETFWQVVCSTFGTKVNSDAFENLAQLVPAILLAKHKNNLLQLEALLLGTAGLFAENPMDEYSHLLLREYLFLKAKYNLQPIHYPIHFLRMRPPNFPTIRLAQLAMLLHRNEHLFSKILEAQNVSSIVQLFSVTASDYWTEHYRLGERSNPTPKKLGSQMVNTIIINSIIPTLFAYGLYNGQEDPKEKAIRWLQQMAPEMNVITKGFANISVGNISAFSSQALIELKNEYCHHKRCLDCAIGNALLRQWNRPA